MHKRIISLVLIATLAACGGNSMTDGSSVKSPAPSPEEMTTNLDEGRIALGFEHALAVHADGRVFAWGRNDYGQIGDGSNFDSSMAVEVRGLSAVKLVRAGELHSLALNRDGTVWAWGNNYQGQLGTGFVNWHSIPTRVVGMSNVKDLSTGPLHSVAVTNNGNVWGWGRAPYVRSNSPVLLTSMSGVKAVAVGSDHSLFLRSDGTVWTLGNNAEAMIADLSKSTGKTLVMVPGLSNVKAIASGYQHALALMKDGTVRAWGSNEFGQLGLGHTVSVRVPTQISGLSGVKSISASLRKSGALDNQGNVYAWGETPGLSSNSTSGKNLKPIVVLKGQQGAAVSVSFANIGVMHKDGKVSMNGRNNQGQLGNNSRLPSESFVTVLGLSRTKPLNIGAARSPD